MSRVFVENTTETFDALFPSPSVFSQEIKDALLAKALSHGRLDLMEKALAWGAQPAPGQWAMGDAWRPWMDAHGTRTAQASADTLDAVLPEAVTPRRRHRL